MNDLVALSVYSSYFLEPFNRFVQQRLTKPRMGQGVASFQERSKGDIGGQDSGTDVIRIEH